MMFTNNKYNKLYFKIIDKAILRKDFVEGELHHIIPRSLGGLDISLNIVKLTYREHFICHWLLIKFTLGLARQKMLNAFGMMNVRCTNKSWQYHRARKAIAEALIGNKRTLGYRHTEATKEIQRLSKLGNAYALGYKHTSKANIKMTAAQIGNKKWLGKRHTEETKIKMRLASLHRIRNNQGVFQAAKVHP